MHISEIFPGEWFDNLLMYKGLLISLPCVLDINNVIIVAIIIMRNIITKIYILIILKSNKIQLRTS